MKIENYKKSETNNNSTLKYKSKEDAIKDHVENYRSDGISKGKGHPHSSDFYRVQFIIDNVGPESYVLDVGCNGGTLGVPLITHKHCYVKGIDVVKELVEKAKKRGVYAELGEAEDLTQFKDEKFDVVICAEVLEHLYDPLPAIKEAHRVLKKGGRYIITVPAPESEMARDGKLGDYHQQNFTIELLHTLLCSSFIESKVKAVLIPYTEVYCQANTKTKQEFEELKNKGQWVGIVAEK